MMIDENPYASPLSTEDLLRELNVVPATVVEETRSRGLFRKGNQLVMHKRAVLPDRCVKSNEPAGGKRLRRSLSWHHPLIYVLVPVSPLIFIIVALLMRKKATIYVGLAEAWSRRRRRAMVVSWTVALLTMVTVVSSIALADPRGRSGDMIPFVLLGGVLTIIGAAIYGLLRTQIVSPARITDDYVWLKGVHPAFLADLPDWPYRP